MLHGFVAGLPEIDQAGRCNPHCPKYLISCGELIGDFHALRLGMDDVHSPADGKVQLTGAASIGIGGKHGASIMCVAPIRLSCLAARNHRLEDLEPCHPSDQKPVFDQRGRHCSHKSALHSRHISVSSEARPLGLNYES